MNLEIRNPHSVFAALETRPHDVLEIEASAGKPTPAWQRVFARATELGIPTAARTRSTHTGRRGGRRDRIPDDSGRQGGSIARIRERSPVSLDQLISDVQPDSTGLWVGLDCLQDPHNVGAIFRSAAFFGVKGILMTKDRSAPMNSGVYDIATGGVEHVPFAIVPNLARALGQCREHGLWILGTSEHASQSIHQVDLHRPWMMMLGNEEKGLRRLTQENCDEMYAIHPHGPVTSLNVSVAAGCLMASLTANP